jgi:hypothetical protein
MIDETYYPGAAFYGGAQLVILGCVAERLGKYFMKIEPHWSAEGLIAIGRCAQFAMTGSFIAFVENPRLKKEWKINLLRAGLLCTGLIPIRALIERNWGDREKAERYERNAYLIGLVVKVTNVGVLFILGYGRNVYLKPVLAGVIVLSYWAC